MPIAFLLLCSCQQLHSGPQPKSYVIPFTMSATNTVVTTATIDASTDNPHPMPKRLVIDTGAAHTCFFASEDDVFAFAKNVPGATMDVSVASDGQVVNVCRFGHGRVTVDGLTVHMPIYASPYNLTMKLDFDGTIGQDFLSRFDVHIDYDAKTVTLTER
jgi:hypothetical protein